jgi:hypothetical protein
VEGGRGTVERWRVGSEGRRRHRASERAAAREQERAVGKGRVGSRVRAGSHGREWTRQWRERRRDFTRSDGRN